MAITKQEFIQKIKTKYPDYQGIDDNTLYDKIITKYPEYKDQVVEEKADEGSNLLGQIIEQQPLMSIPKAGIQAISPAIKKVAGAIGGQRFIEGLKKIKVEAGKDIRGLVKGASMGYVDMPGEESGLAEMVGGIAPYMATAPIGAAVKGAKILSSVPRLARIAGAAAQTGAVGLARPAKTIEERLKRGAGEAVIGGGIQTIPELAGIAKEGIKKYAPEILSKTSALPIEHLKKAMENPKKYLVPPIDKKTELATVSKIKDEVVKNVDDIANFRYKTIEDTVAKEASTQFGRMGGTGQSINSSIIKKSTNEYVNEMMDNGLIKNLDEVPVPLKMLYNRIDNAAVRRYNAVTGKWTKTLTFEQAHKLKQDLYKLNSKYYGKENWTNVVAEGYKRAAKSINDQLRTISPEYAKANDEVKAMYDLSDEIGSKGIESFAGKGGTRKFYSFFNDPDGSLVLENVEKILPKNKQFMPRLLDLEETQAIRKAFMQPKAQGALLSGGGIGAATYYTTKNLPLSATLGGITGAIGSPAAIKYGIKGGAALNALKLPSLPLPGFIK